MNLVAPPWRSGYAVQSQLRSDTPEAVDAVSPEDDNRSVSFVLPAPTLYRRLIWVQHSNDRQR